MKITRFLLPATLALTLGAGFAVPQASAQDYEREDVGRYENDERGWFGDRSEVFGEGRRGWFEDRERRDRFERGYQQGRMDERRDGMRRETYRDNEGYGEYERERYEDDGLFGGLFD